MVPDLVRYGSYTSGVTMHVYNDYPPAITDEFHMVARIPTMPSGKGYAHVGSAVDEQQLVSSTHCYVPFAPTQDFMGGNLNPWETSILRWITVLKYPKGVSVEEGEKWYLDVHAEEVMQQPGLIRFFSYRTMDWPDRALWHRVTEQWYEDYHGWHKAVIESPPKYTKPSWEYDQYPFFEPYKDFLGAFILERPTHDFLRDYLGYSIGP
jgi:hypothetical protein